jgi:hypothetical protein
MTTYSNIVDFWAQRAPWLVPVRSTWSATGTTARGTDTTVWSDPGAVGLSPETANTMWIEQPDDAVAGDRKRRAGGNSGDAIDTTNGYIYPMVAWGNAPQSGERYRLWAIDPQIAWSKLVESLELFFVPVSSPLTRVTDGDLAGSDATSFTYPGAGALTKVTDAANVANGGKALYFNAGGVGEYFRTALMRVIPNQQYFASVFARVDVGGPAIFVVWDETNDVEVESAGRVSHGLESYMTLQRDFTIPATCEEISLRVYCTAATDDIYVGGYAGPYKHGDTVVPLPSSLTIQKYLRKLLVAQYHDTYTSDVYDLNSRMMNEVARSTYYMQNFPTSANPNQLVMRGYHTSTEELWVERLARLSEFVTLAWTATGETLPVIPIEKALIGYDSLKRICEHVLTTNTSDTEVKTTLAQIKDPAGEYLSLLRDYNDSLESPQYPEPTRQRSLASL